MNKSDATLCLNCSFNSRLILSATAGIVTFSAASTAAGTCLAINPSRSFGFSSHPCEGWSSNIQKTTLDNLVTGCSRDNMRVSSNGSMGRGTAWGAGDGAGRNAVLIVDTATPIPAPVVKSEATEPINNTKYMRGIGTDHNIGCGFFSPGKLVTWVRSDTPLILTEALGREGSPSKNMSKPIQSPGLSNVWLTVTVFPSWVAFATRPCWLFSTTSAPTTRPCSNVSSSGDSMSRASTG